MASLNMFFSPAVGGAAGVSSRRRVQTAATAAKGSGGGSEEKSIIDFVLGALQKQDQLLEVDPILNKVEGKSSTTGGKKNTVTIPPKKTENGGFGGFGGLFAKK